MRLVAKTFVVSTYLSSCWQAAKTLSEGGPVCSPQKYLKSFKTVGPALLLPPSLSLSVCLYRSFSLFSHAHRFSGNPTRNTTHRGSLQPQICLNSALKRSKVYRVAAHFVSYSRSLRSISQFKQLDGKGAKERTALACGWKIEGFDRHLLELDVKGGWSMNPIFIWILLT